MSNTIQTAPSSATTAAAPAAVAGKAPVVKKARSFTWYAYQGVQALGSLKLTVALFALSLALVFFGTLAQIDSGIWNVVSNYFRWFWVWVPFQLLVQFGQKFFALPERLQVPGAFPFPGGWTLGGLLLLNVLTSYTLRYRKFWKGLAVVAGLVLLDAACAQLVGPHDLWGGSLLGLVLWGCSLVAVLGLLNAGLLYAFRSEIPWKRLGVLTVHAGLVVMLVGEFATAGAVEGLLVIDEGQTSGTVIQPRYAELAVVSPDPADKQLDHVTVVPGAMLHKAGAVVSSPELPFDIEVVRWVANARLRSVGEGERNPADAGFGTRNVAVDVGEVSGVSTNQTYESPACYVTLKKKDGTALGTYLMAVDYKGQPVEVGGKTYSVALRYKQSQRPYALTLLEFRFDRYPGTDKPKNFSSKVRLVDEERGEDREVTIRMNEPLRHRGETLYQAGYNETTERGTRLQVVRNPVWTLPYTSCFLVSLGMVVHFSLTLVTFLQRRVGA
jgi:hypothetical protein